MKTAIKVFVFCSFFSILIVAMLCYVSANGIGFPSNRNGLLEVIDAQNTKEELLNQLENTADSDLSLADIQNQVILKCHLMGIWYYDGITQLQDPNEIPQYFDNLESNNGKQFLSYLVIGEEVTSVHFRSQGSTYTVESEKLQNTPNYIQDIMDAKVFQSTAITDIKDYENIVCIDGYPSHWGAVVYYLTKTGGTVLYYPNEYSEAQVFRFLDFQRYAHAYKQYITSYDFNYSANGSPKVGDISFLDFVNDLPAQKEPSYMDLRFVIGFFVVIVIIAGIWVYMKKKLKTS